jgi:hypothetical protein
MAERELQREDSMSAANARRLILSAGLLVSRCHEAEPPTAQHESSLVQAAPDANCPEHAGAFVRVVGTHRCMVARRLFWGTPYCPTSRPLAPPELGGPGPKFIGVHPDSVLHACGVRNGDWWTATNGVPMKSPEDALAAYAALERATTIEMKLLREGRELTVAIVLTE